MKICLMCAEMAVEPLLDLGPQPVSSHLTASPTTEAVQHRLGLGACRACGVVQLLSPFPYRSLVPPLAGLIYREPEQHLDAMVRRALTLPGIGKQSTVAGVTYKDQSTLDRFSRLGFDHTWCIDLAQDLGIADPCANIETVQALLTPEKAAEIVRRRGPADILIVRHILEHADNPARLLRAMAQLLRDGGYMIVEVPDCESNIGRQDYTMIWEEHTLYFTRRTFEAIMPVANCRSIATEVAPYTFEDCLVQFGQKLGAADQAPEPPKRDVDLRPIRDYAASFPRWTEAYRALLADGGRGSRRVAIYGAGHLTSAFLNFHGLAGEIDFVVDDTPEKQGRYLPKSGLAVRPRQALDANRTPLCLLGLSPEIEDRVIANNAAFVAAGGQFSSIFAASDRSIRKLMSSPPPHG
jgi:SAM-dependent methyltransferase